MNEKDKEKEKKSLWQKQLEDTMNEMATRKFSYDINGDALYEQYKNNAMKQGKLAMQDTIGQASALTGGYANSYAQTAGQQAYTGYLKELDSITPDLYQAAMDRYSLEGQELQNKAKLLYSMVYPDQVEDEGNYIVSKEIDEKAQSFSTEEEFGNWIDSLIAGGMPEASAEALIDAYGKKYTKSNFQTGLDRENAETFAFLTGNTELLDYYKRADFEDMLALIKAKKVAQGERESEGYDRIKKRILGK